MAHKLNPKQLFQLTSDLKSFKLSSSSITNPARGNGQKVVTVAVAALARALKKSSGNVGVLPSQRTSYFSFSTTGDTAISPFSSPMNNGQDPSQKRRNGG